jgi:uncharacterized protein DUF3276
MADYNEQQEIFSRAVRAGKRTYFFDVRSTRSNEYYLTITESKKKMNEGSEKPFYEKHKLFLYKEDFEKFMEGLTAAVGHIRENQPTVERRREDTERPASNFTNVEFDDLGKDQKKDEAG